MEVLLKQNGKVTTHFRFTEEEVDNILRQSKETDTFTFVNPITMRVTTKRGRIPVEKKPRRVKTIGRRRK